MGGGGGADAKYVFSLPPPAKKRSYLKPPGETRRGGREFLFLLMIPQIDVIVVLPRSGIAALISKGT